MGILSSTRIDAFNQDSELFKYCMQSISHNSHVLFGLIKLFNLQMVVIDEVDSFLFRPHIGLRAKYQAVSNHY